MLITYGTKARFRNSASQLSALVSSDTPACGPGSSVSETFDFHSTAERPSLGEGVSRDGYRGNVRGDWVWSVDNLYSRVGAFKGRSSTERMLATLRSI